MEVEPAAAKIEADEQPVEVASHDASKPEAVQDETSHQDAADEVMEKIDVALLLLPTPNQESLQSRQCRQTMTRLLLQNHPPM